MELPANMVMHHGNRHIGQLVQFKLLDESIDGQPSFRSTATEAECREMIAAMNNGLRECIRIRAGAMVHYRYLKREGKL